MRSWGIHHSWAGGASVARWVAPTSNTSHARSTLAVAVMQTSAPFSFGVVISFFGWKVDLGCSPRTRFHRATPDPPALNSLKHPAARSFVLRRADLGLARPTWKLRTFGC